MNKVTKKVNELITERGWTPYRFEQESGIPAPTIRRWFQSDMYPSIPVLMQVCEAFGITMADFFAEGNLVELTPELNELHADWKKLSTKDRTSVRSIIKSLVDSES